MLEKRIPINSSASGAFVDEKQSFFMSEIVFRSPKSVRQQIVPQTKISQI